MRRNWIAERRRELGGRTQAWLARELGTTQQNVSKIEQGEVRMTADLAHRLARALHLPPETVMFHEEKPQKALTVSGVITVNETLELLNGLAGQEVPVPRAWADEIARVVRIETDILSPRYDPGALLYFGHGVAPEDLDAGDALVFVVGEQPLFRYVEPGTEPGALTLRPYRRDLPVAVNVRPERCEPLLWVRPPRRPPR